MMLDEQASSPFLPVMGRAAQHHVVPGAQCYLLHGHKRPLPRHSFWEIYKQKGQMAIIKMAIMYLHSDHVAYEVFVYYRLTVNSGRGI